MKKLIVLAIAPFVLTACSTFEPVSSAQKVTTEDLNNTRWQCEIVGKGPQIPNMTIQASYLYNFQQNGLAISKGKTDFTFDQENVTYSYNVEAEDYWSIENSIWIETITGKMAVKSAHPAETKRRMSAEKTVAAAADFTYALLTAAPAGSGNEYRLVKTSPTTMSLNDVNNYYTGSCKKL